MAIEDRIYEKSVEYLSDIPELADEKMCIRDRND